MFYPPLFRPGHGAPTGDIRKKKFTEYQLDRSMSSSNLDQLDQYVKGQTGHISRWGSALALENSPGCEDAMSFGRPGYGAPVRTGSGRLRSEVRGNPEIRFQANEGVQNSICNQIRYSASKEEKAKYHSELGSDCQLRLSCLKSLLQTTRSSGGGRWRTWTSQTASMSPGTWRRWREISGENLGLEAHTGENLLLQGKDSMRKW